MQILVWQTSVYIKHTGNKWKCQYVMFNNFVIHNLCNVPIHPSGIFENFSSKFVDIFGKMRIILFCMDTMNDCIIPECGNLANLAGKRVVVGAKQLRKALQSGRAKFVYLAKNADPAITEPIEAMCQLNKVSYAWVGSMQDLGRACGIEVSAAAAAAVD